MQNIISRRQISINLLAFIAALVAVALLVGFIAGRVSTPSASSASHSQIQEPQTILSDSIDELRNQRLLKLNEGFYPSPESATRDSLVELRYQRILQLNEMFYPSPSSDPAFWSGRPH